ncbi:MAG TPA: phosphatase PAP2 family protein [Methylophilaceae bacterium]|nr:phosphatase PAP2 family protein [Methylophilaceae bacterium]
MEQLDAEEAALLSAVEFAGSNALTMYLACLALLLLFVTVVTRVLQRHPVQVDIDTPSARALITRLMMGFIIIVACGAIFAGLADEIDIKEDLALLDGNFTQAVASHTPAAAITAFSYITHLGDTWVLTGVGIIVAATLFLRRQIWLAWGWILAVAGNGLLNPSLKAVFERMRPLDMHGMPFTEGWSFPSGHASGSVVTYGMLAYVLIRNLPPAWHLPIILLAAALAFTVGCSRIFLQYHYGSDVLAGFASGSAWLAVCISSLEALRWRQLRGPSSKKTRQPERSSSLQ